MNSSTEIETRVIALIRSQLHVTNPKLDARTRFVDDLGADSLALIELTIAFEEMFDIDITDAEAAKIRTVRDAIISVEKCLRAQRRG